MDPKNQVLHGDNHPIFPGIPAILILLAILGVAPAYAAEIPSNEAVRSIIGEAENQGYEGMYAVACAIRNRGTLKGVYGSRSIQEIGGRLFRVSPDGRRWRISDDTWQKASKAWFMSADGPDITNGATHWENVRDFGAPEWAHGMYVTLIFRGHEFYKEVGK